MGWWVEKTCRKGLSDIKKNLSNRILKPSGADFNHGCPCSCMYLKCCLLHSRWRWGLWGSSESTEGVWSWREATHRNNRGDIYTSTVPVCLVKWLQYGNLTKQSYWRTNTCMYWSCIHPGASIFCHCQGCSGALRPQSLQTAFAWYFTIVDEKRSQLAAQVVKNVPTIPKML